MAQAAAKNTNTTDGKLTSRKTCTVGLKSPNGLILRLFNEEKRSEPVMGGGMREYKIAVPNQQAGTVRLHGTAVPFGVIPKYRIEGGYALTKGVDVEFMKKWMEQNEEHDLVKNKLIFVQADIDDAEAEAAEKSEVWDGLHPIVPDSDNRIPKGPRGMKIETGTRD